MQTSVNRGLNGMWSVGQHVWALGHAKKCCEYKFKDSDGLCAGSVSKRRNGNNRTFVYQTHMWVVLGVFMNQQKAIDILRSTYSDQERGIRNKMCLNYNISKLWISLILPAPYLRSMIDSMHDLRLFWLALLIDKTYVKERDTHTHFWYAKDMDYNMVSSVLHHSTI